MESHPLQACVSVAIIQICRKPPCFDSRQKHGGAFRPLQ